MAALPAASSFFFSGGEQAATATAVVAAMTTARVRPTGVRTVGVLLLRDRNRCALGGSWECIVADRRPRYVQMETFLSDVA
ncbi:hypothetical protein Ato02nite_055950 [Paractinoplanes toevensis]|uniref:Uncharacterized protein n=1 Tax=Paractinoplanes toevensis TaxID=571911 RepID=A0A919TEE9_9ACTN|nr:hypothetical protein Ato02nite_055950 [Actinoplanes toevensis]